MLHVKLGSVKHSAFPVKHFLSKNLSANTAIVCILVFVEKKISPPSPRDFGLKSDEVLPLVAHSWTKFQVVAWLKQQKKLREAAKKMREDGQEEMFS